MLQVVTKRVMKNPLDTAKELKNMYNVDLVKWRKEMKPKWEAARKQNKTDTMKKFFTIFFSTLGVLSFLLIAAGVIFLVVNPNNIRSSIPGLSKSSLGRTADKNPALNAAQEKTLETLGVDPASVPSSITPAQEKCFVSVLGASRVVEIKAGDTPSATEYFKAKGCL